MLEEKKKKKKREKTFNHSIIIKNIYKIKIKNLNL